MDLNVPNDKFESELELSFGRDRQALSFGQLFNNTRLQQGQLGETARYAFSGAIVLRGGRDYLFQRYRQEAQLPEAFLSQEGDGNDDNDLAESALAQRARRSLLAHERVSCIAGFHRAPRAERAVDAAARVGNPNLGLERAVHYSAGFEYQPLRHIHLDVYAVTGGAEGRRRA